MYTCTLYLQKSLANGCSVEQTSVHAICIVSTALFCFTILSTYKKTLINKNLISISEINPNQLELSSKQ